MASLPTTLPPDENRAPRLLASFWVPFSFTVIFMVTRFYARAARKRLGADDWTMLAAWIFYTISVSLSAAIVVAGGARHVYYLSLDQVQLITHLNVATQVVAPLANATAKAAVALLLPRILQGTSKWRKWWLYTNVAIFMATVAVSWSLLFTQCIPTRALWDLQLQMSGQGTCPHEYRNTVFGIAQGAFGAYLDFMLALFPLLIVYKLQAPLKKKLAICALLGLGVFAGACAVLRTILFANAFAATSDPTWNSFGVFLWGGLEIPFVIIGGCVPPSVPIWDYFINGKPIMPGGAGRSVLIGQSWWQSLRSRSNRSQPIDISADSGFKLSDSHLERQEIMVKKTIGVEEVRMDSNEHRTPYADKRWGSRDTSSTNSS